MISMASLLNIEFSELEHNINPIVIIKYLLFSITIIFNTNSN